MKQLLLTNDDGIDSDGLQRLAAATKEFGEVWIVAPDGQRSAASHSITLHRPIDLYPVDYPVEGVHALKCNGTPADCVRVGSLAVMPQKPDILLSGINHGYNVASDIQYSATAGAAFEGAFQGIHSIALSEGFGECHEVSDHYLSEVLRALLEAPLSYGEIWNVNFPDCRLEECKGIQWNRKVSRGMFYRDNYNKTEDLSDGGIRLMVEGQYNEDAEAETDFLAVVEHSISVGKVQNVG